MIKQVLYPTVEIALLRVEMTEEESERFDNLTPEEKTEFVLRNENKENLPPTYWQLIQDYFKAGLDKFEIQRGVCKQCGCTESDGCHHPLHGSCYWVDENENLCSHCADPEIANSPERTKPHIKKAKF